MQGTICRIVKAKGFGFIRSGETEYFFHASCLDGTAAFELLREGQSVTFSEGQGDRGPRASRVRLALEQTEAPF